MKRKIFVLLVAVFLLPTASFGMEGVTVSDNSAPAAASGSESSADSDSQADADANVNVEQNQQRKGAQEFANPARKTYPGFAEKPDQREKERAYNYTPIKMVLWRNKNISAEKADRMMLNEPEEYTTVSLDGPFPETSSIRAVLNKNELKGVRAYPSAIAYVKGDAQKMAEIIGCAAQELMWQGANVMLFIKGDVQQKLEASSLGLGGGSTAAFLSGGQLQGLTLDGGAGYSVGSATQTGQVWVQALGLHVPNIEQQLRDAQNNQSWQPRETSAQPSSYPKKSKNLKK